MNIGVLQYVISAPYFWLSMGMVTAMSMFIGAAIYNGDLSLARKGIVSILVYCFFIAQVNVTRATSSLNVHVKPVDITNEAMLYASTTALLIITVFWVIGVIIGVYVSDRIRRKK